MNQSEKLRKYFDRGFALTVLGAIKLFGVYALSQRVGELKREGYPIEKRMVKVESGARVAQYRKRVGG